MATIPAATPPASHVGVHAMSITPFDESGAIDDGLFRAHVRFLAGAGVGVYVASQGSGEGDLLTVDEKVSLYAAASVAAGGRVPVVAAGIGLAASTASTRALAVAARDAGVDAVQIIAPRPGPLRLRADEIEAYFRAVIEAIDCDVHLSNNTALAGYAIPVEIIERLAGDYPHVRAINVSDPRVNDLRVYVGRLVAGKSARVEVRVGVVREMTAMYELGARGVLCFEPNVLPEIVTGAWARLGVGDTSGMEALLRLNSALARGGNPRSLKAALTMLGRDGGALRAPYLPLTDAQYAELENELRVLAPPANAGPRDSGPEDRSQ